jgi:hypothetical protein
VHHTASSLGRGHIGSPPTSAIALDGAAPIRPGPTSTLRVP